MTSHETRPLHQAHVRALHVVELRDLPDGQPWVVFPPEDGHRIAIRADLTGQEREQALGAALARVLGLEPGTAGLEPAPARLAG